MKGTTMILATLCLLLCWMQPVGAKKIGIYHPKQDAPEVIPLGMVEDAVDDMYSNCKEWMENKVNNSYFKKETSSTLFGSVWTTEQGCANERLKNREQGDEALTKDHMQAICVYTSGKKNFYKEFNVAVRTDKKKYGSSFKFHALHFWLTSAVQILNQNRSCLTAYRRTKDAFTGNVNQTIRFGNFASSSLKKDLTHFGSETCFKITTCFGASLKKYPTMKDKEAEVLIPPYEMFNIDNKLQNKLVKGLTDCKVVYVLKSAGVQSNLDCRLARNRTKASFFNWSRKVRTDWGV